MSWSELTGPVVGGRGWEALGLGLGLAGLAPRPLRFLGGEGLPRPPAELIDL